jgi:hypothetical protein
VAAMAELEAARAKDPSIPWIAAKLAELQSPLQPSEAFRKSGGSLGRQVPAVP